MPKESTKATITSFAGTPLVRVVDGTLSRNISPANLVAESGAQTALDGRYVLNDGETDDVDLSTASSVVVPDGTADGHAAAISAVASSLGRFDVQGYQIGDTGWRDVTADLVNGWVKHNFAARLNLRRSGNIVTVHVSRGIVGTAATDDVFYTVPAGFRMSTGDDYTILQPAIVNTTPTIGMLAIDPNNGELSSARAAAVRMSFSVTWMTDDAWPATLPGSAT